MAQLNTKQTALSLGVFFAVLHALWAIAVAAGFAQPLLKWKLAHHFLIIEEGIAQFDLVTAILLVVGAFVTGTILGWLFAAIWNWVGKKVK